MLKGGFRVTALSFLTLQDVMVSVEAVLSDPQQSSQQMQDWLAV